MKLNHQYIVLNVKSEVEKNADIIPTSSTQLLILISIALIKCQEKDSDHNVLS